MVGEIDKIGRDEERGLRRQVDERGEEVKGGCSSEERR